MATQKDKASSAFQYVLLVFHSNESCVFYLSLLRLFTGRRLSRCPESLGSSGQVLVAQYLGLARDSHKASGLDAKAAWGGDALESRETARSIAKRVLTLSLGLGISLAACSRLLFPALLSVVCQSREVAALVSQVGVGCMIGMGVCCPCTEGRRYGVR